MERNWRRLAEEEEQEGTERALTAYGVYLSQVTSFKYLGIVLAAEDDYWLAVVRNLQCARHKWARLTRVLIREVEDAQTSVNIYLAVVQLVLLYGSDTWVLTLRMQKVLGVFQRRVDRRLTVRQPQKGGDGGWVYPPLEDAMAEAGLREVETYVSCRQNTVAQYISTGPIIDLYMAVKRRPGPRVAMR